VKQEQDAIWLTERAHKHADAVGKRGPTDSWGRSEPLLKKKTPEQLTEDDHVSAAVSAAGWVLRHRCPAPQGEGRWGDDGLVTVVALAGLPQAVVYRAWRAWRRAHDRHILGEVLLALRLWQEEYRLVRFHANGTRIKSGRARKERQAAPAQLASRGGAR
jgi:hypothetical protein